MAMTMSTPITIATKMSTTLHPRTINNSNNCPPFLITSSSSLFSLTRRTLVAVGGVITTLSSSTLFALRSADLSNLSLNPSAVGDWTPPQRVSCIANELCRNCGVCGDYFGTCQPNHYLVRVNALGPEFDTEQALFHYYIKIAARVVGSEEEAKKKIYLVSCGPYCGFGIEMDVHAYAVLNYLPPVVFVKQDCFYDARKKDTNVQSAAQFTPMNHNRRLDNITNYYSLSERNPKWDFNHWLIKIKQPPGGFRKTQQIFDFCVKILAKVVGSKEAAIEKIYIIWYTIPFGFGVEIDEASSKKLGELRNVLDVLPDYAFDVKDIYKGQGALCIHPSPNDTVFSYGSLAGEYDYFKDWLISPGDLTYSPGKFDLNLCQDPYLTEWGRKSDCKHWIVIMYKPVKRFASRQPMIHLCIRMLAIALGVGREEAKRKLYRVTDMKYFVFFAVEIDWEIKNKLEGIDEVLEVLPDAKFNKYPKGDISSLNGLK